jgi:3-oxo-5alpha-steroid 4-dehydrogenase
MTGRKYFAALRAAVERLGVRVLANTPAVRLIQDGAGEVIGVEACAIPAHLVRERRQLFQRIQPLPFLMRKARKAMDRIYGVEREHGETRRLRARGGVILATGGYGYNQELIQEHAPVIARHSEKIIRVGSLGCDGSGIELGRTVGGDIGLMGNVMMSQTMGPNILRKGIFVNRTGNRFIGEDAYNGEIGGTIAQQQDSAAWLILGNDQFWQAVWDCVTCPKGTFFYLHLPSLLRLVVTSRFSWSIARLAKSCGIAPPSLAETVRRYNQAIDEGRPDENGKAKKLLGRIVRRPFWAVNYSTSNYFSFVGVFTLGGLKVASETGEVVDRDGQPIHGLYAAGRAAVGLCSTALTCSPEFMPLVS